MKRCSPSLIIREMQIKPTMRLPSHTCQDGYCPKKNYKITNIENDGKKLEPFCTVGGSVKWHSHLKAESWRCICILMSITALLTTAVMWKSLNVQQWMNRLKKMWSIHKMKYYTSFKKEDSLVMNYQCINLKDIIQS